MGGRLVKVEGQDEAPQDVEAGNHAPVLDLGHGRLPHPGTLRQHGTRQAGPAISTGGAHLGDGSWEREVTRSVLQFRGMHTVEEYIDKTGEIVASNAALFAPTVVE
ncbi:hypothetical protein SAMN04487983_104867 [Streptomyces sp. yr375]|nr:hypothetical protein SAMN04487983_104867 [Streptomyces sp. yr375]